MKPARRSGAESQRAASIGVAQADAQARGQTFEGH